ncbi:MAG: cell division protein FtsI [Streptosporangiaceae bacterium]|nr:cell division protein FtsI [Streptosporangiaceae bacterium]
MRHRGRMVLLVAIAVTTSLLGAACSSPPPPPPPGPQGNAAAFLSAWARQDWPAMRALTVAPPADFAAVNQNAFTAMSVRQATFTAGKLKVKGTAASEPVTERLALAGLGSITVPTALHLTQQTNGRWLVDWEPATIIPQLKPGDHVKVRLVWPARAPVLAADGTPLAPLARTVAADLEVAQERRLAGTPRADITVVDGAGHRVATVATVASHPGKAVRTTIDPAIQNAAEAAMASEKKSAALIAVNARTGAVLAAVSANAGGFDQAIDGGFPPGSTFKILDSTALIEHGLTPASTASCPKTITEDGEVFHNAEGDGPVSTLLQAFTESCNTAFIGLVSSQLTASDVHAVGALYRLGKTMHIGVTAFSGSVPEPVDGADLAATSIGQGRVLVSPLDMAMVAAAVDTGTVRSPRLVIGDGSASATRLPAGVVSGLHTMMASVVASGTAAGTGLPAGTYAKTGTAQFGTTKPLKLDAWLVGFRGDIAFAALVVDSPGDGGPTCGPIVARFLSAAA